MSAFYGLRRRNLKRKRCTPASGRSPRRAAAAAFSGLGLLASACSGVRRDDPAAGLSCVDDSTECVDQRQVTLKSMLADKERKLGQGADHAAGACLGRPAVRLPQPQEGAQLRGAGARAARGRQRGQVAARARKARACHRLRSRAPPCSPPRSARSSPPRCGPAAARREASRCGRGVSPRPRPAGARSAPTPAGDRSRPRAPCRRAATASSGDTKM